MKIQCQVFIKYNSNVNLNFWIRIKVMRIHHTQLLIREREINYFTRGIMLIPCIVGVWCAGWPGWGGGGPGQVPDLHPPPRGLHDRRLDMLSQLGDHSREVGPWATTTFKVVDVFLTIFVFFTNFGSSRHVGTWATTTFKLVVFQTIYVF